jgi:hypothetical protein
MGFIIAGQYQYIGDVPHDQTQAAVDNLLTTSATSKPSVSAVRNTVVGQNTSTAFASVYQKHPKFSQLEYTYQSTFRNCLGATCFNAEVTTDSGKTILRVGILGLEAAGSQSIYDMLRKVVSQKEFAKFDVVTDTHVPPYGYGKNHGWSSIIRISRRLVQHSYSLVRPQIEADLGSKTDYIDQQVSGFCSTDRQSINIHFVVLGSSNYQMAVSAIACSCTYKDADR